MGGMGLIFTPVLVQHLLGPPALFTCLHLVLLDSYLLQIVYLWLPTHPTPSTHPTPPPTPSPSLRINPTPPSHPPPYTRKSSFIFDGHA